MTDFFWFLFGCLKMYLMWCFCYWEFPLSFSGMEPYQRGFFLFLTIMWGIEVIFISKFIRGSES